MNYIYIYSVERIERAHILYVMLVAGEGPKIK